MPAPPLQQIVRRIGALVESDRPARTDADLLRAFRTATDSTAFAEIIHRHGGLVMSVCRRVLGNHASADDAWQATFLILARRAGSIRNLLSLAGWLHGVAYRTALNERRAASRRTAHEAAANLTIVPTPDRQAAWRELQALVDAEVQRLPAHLREVFIRCALENECRADLAACLGLNEGTVRSRLSAARRLLRDRLKRKGVELSVALALVAATSIRVEASLAETTVEAAVCFASREWQSALISPQVAALVGGATRGFGFARVAAVVVFIALGIAGLGLNTAQPDAKEPPPKKEPKASAAPVADHKVESDPLPTGALARFGTTRFRTGNMVTGLVFSPNGKQIASWGNKDEDQFTLWDALTGKELWTARMPNHSLLALGWPKDGNGLAILQSGALWDFTIEKRKGLANHDADGALPQVGSESVLYKAAAISADGKMLAAATDEGANQPRSIAICELKAAKSIGELKILAACEEPSTQCTKLAFTPNGSRLVGVCTVVKDGKPTEAGKIVIWTKAGKIERTIDAPIGARNWDKFHLHVSNGLLALALADGDTFVVALDTGKSRTFRTGHKLKQGGAGVLALAFAPDEKSLATAGLDNIVRLTDTTTGKTVREFGPHRSWPQALAFSADGTRLVSGGQDGVLRVWDTVKGNEAVPTGGHPYRVWWISASANARTVVTEGGDNILHIWDAATGKELRQINAGGNVTSCKLTPDAGQVIAVVGGWDDPKRTLKVWDVTTGEDATPRGFPQTLAAFGFRFTPDGKTLVTYHDDKLTAWTWPGGKHVWAADLPKPANQPGSNRIDSIAIAPDGRQVVTVASRSWNRVDRGLTFGYAADGVIDLWDMETGKRVRRLVESNGAVFRPAVFAADGMLIHSGGGLLPGPKGKTDELPSSICVIDPLTGRLVRAFARPSRGGGAGHGIVLSADGKALFRSTDPGEVQVFEVATGKFRTSRSGHLNEILALDAPAADVRRVVSGSCDTTALLWDVGFDGKKSAPIAEADRARLWQALADADAAPAYKAMLELAGDPAVFVALANEKLKPASAGPTRDLLTPILRDLDSPKFATRDAASTQLDKFGEGAIPLVRAELEKVTSVEVKERLIKYLEKYDGMSEERLVQIRAVELLEHLGTTEARGALKKLAGGGPSRMTDDAASALKRLANRR